MRRFIRRRQAKEGARTTTGKGECRPWSCFSCDGTHQSYEESEANEKHHEKPQRVDVIWLYREKMIKATQVGEKYHGLSYGGIDKDGTNRQYSIELSDEGGHKNQHKELEHVK
ncbi:hypothetical protein GOBAR_DD21025 [Gossypium barbadense]|nr:hypothetical protein GOBAR_DD21025 [Gossypium barbadense]